MANRSGRIRPLLLSPYLLALPVTILFIFLLPDYFNKYLGGIVKSGLVHKKDGFEYYADLNGDGKSERIVLFNNTEGKASIKILDQKDFILGHYYFTGEIIPDSRSFLPGIFNVSGQTGLFLMTRSNDSILLHGLCPASKEKILFRDQFITTISKQNGVKDYTIPEILLYDLDHDGTKEIISGIMAGFQVQPRFLFTYNIRTGHLMKTPPMASFQSIIDIADLNVDGFPELLAHSYAIDNNEGKQQLPFDDHSAWLTVFDHNLQFFFPPVQFQGKYISLAPLAMTMGVNQRIILLMETRVPGTGPAKLLLFDTSGKLLKQRVLDDTLRIRRYNLIRSDDHSGRIFLLHENGIVEVLGSDMEVIDRNQIEGVNWPTFYQYDIDNDGSREFLFTGVNGSPFVITREDFSHPVSIGNPFEFSPGNFSVIREPEKPGSLFIQSGNRYVICSYERNPMYRLKFPVYLAIYLLVLGFIMVIRYLQRLTLRQRYEAEKKIAGMQLLLMGNQLDPHFTFNAINAISASILQEKPELANKNLLALSRLMRSSVLQSDKISRSLAEELDFLQNYISLIHSRMNGSFDYFIDLDKDVDLAWQVPKMITQIFAENAIKHGLKPLKGGGLIKIRVRHEDPDMILEIEDNGIGRKAARANGETGTGKGIPIMEQTISIINRFNQKKIRLTVTDLENEQGDPLGTKVTIIIPVNLNYRFYAERGR